MVCIWSALYGMVRTKGIGMSNFLYDGCAGVEFAFSKMGSWILYRVEIETKIEPWIEH